MGSEESLKTVEGMASQRGRNRHEDSAPFWLFNLIEHFVRLRHYVGNRALTDTDTDLVSDFEMNDIVADFDDGAVDATTRDDSITSLEILQHLAEVSLFLLLGSDQQEIKNRKHRDER